MESEGEDNERGDRVKRWSAVMGENDGERKRVCKESAKDEYAGEF